MTEFLLLNDGSSNLLLNDGSSKLLLNGGEITTTKTGGGGKIKRIRRKEQQTQFWDIFGKLIMNDNLKIISSLMREEIHETKGFLKQQQITEIIGRLCREDQIKLNAKLRILEGIKIKEGINPSYYKILLDILDEL